MATGFSVLDALNENSKRGIDATPKARFRTKDISIHKIYSNCQELLSTRRDRRKSRRDINRRIIENLAVMYAPSEEGEYKLTLEKDDGEH